MAAFSFATSKITKIRWNSLRLIYCLYAHPVVKQHNPKQLLHPPRALIQHPSTAPPWHHCAAAGIAAAGDCWPLLSGKHQAEGCSRAAQGLCFPLNTHFHFLWSWVQHLSPHTTLHDPEWGLSGGWHSREVLFFPPGFWRSKKDFLVPHTGYKPTNLVLWQGSEEGALSWLVGFFHFCSKPDYKQTTKNTSKTDENL